MHELRELISQLLLNQFTSFLIPWSPQITKGLLADKNYEKIFTDALILSSLNLRVVNSTRMYSITGCARVREGSPFLNY